MTWEIIVIVLIFVFTNVGQTYFTTWRLTAPDFIKKTFQKDTPLKDVQSLSIVATDNTRVVIEEILSIQKQLEDLKAEMSLMKTLSQGGYEQIYSLLMRGPQVKIAELIEQEFEKKNKELKKREQDVMQLASKIEDYGKVILKYKG